MTKLLKTLTAAAISSMVIVGISSPVAANDKEFAKDMEKYLEKDENVAKIGDALEEYFRNKRANQQQNAAQAEEKQLEEQFKNPEKIDIGSSYVKGKKDAPITVIEFSDFQCPFCSRGMETMYELLEEYPNDVKVVFKHLPLPFHNKAKPAAIAAEAAGKQGKFWEFHDLLFKNQSKISEDYFVQAAKELGLDVDKFKKDLSDKALEKKVDEDMALANKLGVRGTPGFFVNGVQVRGARPLPYFKTLVDRWKKELKK